METPQCDPQHLILAWDIAPIRSWSNALVKNVEKVLTKGTVRPLVEQPIATPIRFCSAMKHSMKRLGCAFLNFSEYVEFFVSPSMAMIRLLLLPSLTMAVPYAKRVATYIWKKTIDKAAIKKCYKLISLLIRLSF